MLLETLALTKHFGGVTAVNEVDLTVAEGETLGLIGPNGAGKTTLINLMSGVLRADRGRIRFAGDDVTDLPAHWLTKRGIARTFQAVRIFKGLTSFENVLIGRHVRMRPDLLSRMVPGRPSAIDVDRARAGALLERLGLARRASSLAGELAYGDQRRLEIARALASEPRLLILDEPAAGMNPTESADLRALMRGLVSEGLTIILIEHDVRLIMGACDRVVVLNFGRKIADATPSEVQRDPAVREAYLGSEDAA